jgi:hypothetical protein
VPSTSAGRSLLQPVLNLCVLPVRVVALSFAAGRPSHTRGNWEAKRLERAAQRQSSDVAHTDEQEQRERRIGSEGEWSS